MRIVHILHGLYGRSNGVDTYLRVFTKNIGAENFLIIPKNKCKNKDDFENVILIKSLAEVKGIVENLKPDLVILHYTGAESFTGNNKFLFFEGKIIKKTSKKETIDFNPYAFINVFRIIPDTIPIVLISHACYKLPEHIQYPAVNCIVSVSKKAYEIHKHLATNHAIIYPASDVKAVVKQERKYKRTINIGWLGNLAKLEPASLEFLIKHFGNEKDVLFLFAGAGNKPENPPNNFKFLGNQKPDVFLNELDLFLYPSQVDSFSLAVLEATRMALPCLVSDEVKELGNIIQAIVFDDKEQLFNLLTSFISDMKKDRDSLKKYWQSVGLNSQRLANSDIFSLDGFKKQWYEVFEALKIWQGNQLENQTVDL